MILIAEDVHYFKKQYPEGSHNPKESKTATIFFNYDDINIFVLGGKTTTGEEIKQQKIKNEVKGALNPTKVFFFIAKVLKKTLCPECK